MSGKQHSKVLKQLVSDREADRAERKQLPLSQPVTMLHFGGTLHNLQKLLPKHSCEYLKLSLTLSLKCQPLNHSHTLQHI